MDHHKWTDWIFRFVKGIFIGSGFILPGISGGAMAAVFGIYEQIISFLSNITRNFKENMLFFLPVGFGALFGMFVFSFVVSYMLGDANRVYTLWFFLGCIVGMLPALFRQSAKKGRKPWHLWLMAAVCAASFFLLSIYKTAESQEMAQAAAALAAQHGPLTWLMAGGLIGLGVIVPGLSPSNLLVYMDLYKPMADGIKDLDFTVILPLMAGMLACVILLSKLMSYIFSKAYAVLYHCILGFVLASTLIIVPLNFNYLSLGVLWCIVAFAAGGVLAYYMSMLEAKYKPES